jgi:hypothetical protein
MAAWLKSRGSKVHTANPFLAYLSGIDGILPAPVANAPADNGENVNAAGGMTI